jgi:CARDB protein
MKSRLPFLCTMAMVAAVILVATGLPIIPTAFAQQFKTRPLYRYQSAKGNYLFATDSSLPSGLSDGPWENEGIVCHVPIPTPRGTKPVYMLSKSDDIGLRYVFTSDPAEANSGWTNSGLAFHVASSQLAGTVPLYRLYKPLIPEKKNDTSLLAKIKRAISGPDFTESIAGVLQDTTFYTTQENEKASALQGGFISQGVLGYVWLSSQPPAPKALADLVLRNVDAAPSSVSAIVVNQGQGNTGGTKYSVVLEIYDRKGSVVQTLVHPGPGLSPGQSAPIKFQVGGVLSNSMRGKSFKVRVDTDDAVNESNEGNNETIMLDGPAAIEATALASPILVITNKRDEGERTTYMLTIPNSDKYPASYFQLLDALPPSPCGEQKTKARMLMRISAEANGRVYVNRCTPLASPQALRAFNITIPTGIIAQAKISVVVEDRLLGVEQKSLSQFTGLYGLTLPTCKNFLGRQGELWCESKVSYDACENLKKNGVPVKCGIIGKFAPK